MGSVFKGACVGLRSTLSLSRHEDGELLSCFERMAMGEDCERSEEKKDLGNHGRGLLLLLVLEVLSGCKPPNTHEDTAYIYLSFRPISIPPPTHLQPPGTGNTLLKSALVASATFHLPRLMPCACLPRRRSSRQLISVGVLRGASDWLVSASVLGEASLTLTRLRLP